MMMTSMCCSIFSRTSSRRLLVAVTRALTSVKSLRGRSEVARCRLTRPGASKVGTQEIDCRKFFDRFSSIGTTVVAKAVDTDEIIYSASSLDVSCMTENCVFNYQTCLLCHVFHDTFSVCILQILNENNSTTKFSGASHHTCDFAVTKTLYLLDICVYSVYCQRAQQYELMFIEIT